MRLCARVLALAAVALLLAAPARAMQDEVFARDRVAINGYDPVSYFDGTPMPGSTEHSLEWKGAEWRFASQASMEKFRADPAAYAPQYGGYCAYAVSQGYTAKSEPDAWTIVDGKLYLNYSKGVRKRWEADQTTHISQADSNWPKMLKK